MEINARKHPTKREKREETHKHKRREERSRKRSRFHSPDRVLALSENVEDCEEKVTLEIWEEKSSFILRFLVECRLIRGCEETEFDEFSRRLIQFQRKQSKCKPTSHAEHKKNNQIDTIDIPSQFDHRYLINFTTIDPISLLQASTTSDSLRQNSREKVSFALDHGISLSILKECRHMAQLFRNFKQNQQFQQIQKLFRERNALPIAGYKQAIIDAVRNYQVVVIAGDTGCGKSTQVPQFLLQHGFRKIACTQPRRLAAISLCRRVSQETLNEFGSQVAYQIRFESNREKDTRILFLTEGLLLRLIQSDPLLEQFDVIMLDEVHERHSTCDILLGVLKQILEERPHLKLILMSATINTTLFSNYFNQAPIIEVPGRLYPIKVEYFPQEDSTNLAHTDQSTTQSNRLRSQLKHTIRLDISVYKKLLQKIELEFSQDEKGDLLIFVSGVQEIDTLVQGLREFAKETKKWIVLPLHSQLSIEDQDKVFHSPPEGSRKCIVSTNIAETSVTIDGIRFVIDSGKGKEMGFDPNSRLQTLQVIISG